MLPWLILSACFALCLNPPTDQADDALLARLKDEGIATWRQTLPQLSQIPAREECTRKLGEEVTFSVSNEFKSFDSNYLFHTTNHISGSEMVIGYNHKYYFHINRDRKTGFWKLTQWQPRETAEPIATNPISGIPLCHNVAHVYDGVYVHDMLNESAFSVDNLRLIHEGDTEIVAVSFHRMVPAGRYKMASCSLELVPSEAWRIRRSVIYMDTHAPHTLTTTRTIQRSAAGVICPLGQSEVLEAVRPIRNGIHIVSSECRITLLEATRSQNIEPFTLSAFGLPEPYGIEWDRPTPWWLYALISAGVLFVVMLLLSLWKRRLAARQAA
ncbi:MAG TPA: hypothetical protein PKD86_15985 [Gemmatales bacterium]|nr:hypothetical protein [Gemmatales bacterium]HMP60845.1 hypothetical protein [Gemmatales bacterium]